MSDEKLSETPRTGDWWCPECKEALPGSRVTFTERCDTCGTPVHVAGEGEVARLERELAQKTGLLQRIETALRDACNKGDAFEARAESAERRVSELEAKLTKKERLRVALAELVELKKIKRRMENNTAHPRERLRYEQGKEQAWSQAETALAAERKESSNG